MYDAMLDWGNLCSAWQQIADNRGAPGLDQVSIQRFARGWEGNLRRQRELLLAQRYRPARLRRIAIPKAVGGQRLLQIPTIADRVLQRAALNVLDPIYEGLFLDCSFGYRRGLGVRQALNCILAYRDHRRLTWVLDADIDECFDSIDHATLLPMLMDEVRDYRMLKLIRGWLEIGRRRQHPDRGIALGMPISPLLCNIYLHRLDAGLRQGGWVHVRYADDFILLCGHEREAEEGRAAVQEILAGLHLQLDPGKTRVTSFDHGFDFLGIHFEGKSYRFTHGKRKVTVSGRAPAWMWNYLPEGYD